MKKRPLHFLGRKDNSLFGTNVKMKDMDDMELVLGSAAIPESGTASVRARPTVKHHTSTYDSLHGFAVPTPTVPLYAPAVNGTKINGSVSDDQSSNGSTISITDPVEGEIFVPPPPSSAPPPPPEFFILPPPEFLGDLSTLQPPPKPAPKPPKPFVSLQEEDLTFFNPPPKPPSTGSTGSASVPIAGPLSPPVPEHPKFAPPQPPTEKPQKTVKAPPPKPIRISSIPCLDSPPDTPAPPPPVHTPTLSTFNPQSPAKIYNAPKTTFLKEERETKAKPILLLEDTGSSAVVVKNDVKIPAKPVPTIPAPPKAVEEVKHIEPVVPKEVKEVKDIYAIVSKDYKPSEVKEIESPPKISVPPPSPQPKPNQECKTITVDESPPKISVPPPSSQPKPNQERKPITAATLKDIAKSPKPHRSSQLQKVNGAPDTTITTADKPEGYPTPSGKYSPLLDRKLNSLKTKEPTGPRESSPLALLKAAKEREKQRAGSINETSAKNEQPSYYASSLSLNLQDVQSPKFESPVASPKQLQVNSQLPSTSPSTTVQVAPSSVTTPAPMQVNKVDLNMPKPQTQVNSQVPRTSLTPSKTLQASENLVVPSPSPTPVQVASVTKPAPVQLECNKADWNVPKQPQVNVQVPSTSLTPSKTVQAALPSVAKPKPALVQVENNKVDLNVPFLPPPPEFEDFGDEEEPPPAMRPPDPPKKNLAPLSPPPIPPPPPPKVTPPPPAPQLPPISDTTIQPIKLKPPPVMAKKHKLPTASSPTASVPISSAPTASAPLPTPVSANQATLLNILKKKMQEMDQKMGPVSEPESNSDDWGTPLSDEENKMPIVPKVTAQNNTVVNKAATLDMRELQSKVAAKSSKKMPTSPTSNGPSRHKYGMTFTVRPGTKQPITLVSRGEP